MTRDESSSKLLNPLMGRKNKLEDSIGYMDRSAVTATSYGKLTPNIYSIIYFAYYRLPQPSCCFPHKLSPEAIAPAIR